MLLPPSFSAGAAAVAELQGWAAGLMGTLPDSSGPFMRDLVRWMRFQACTQQQQQQQHGMVAARDADLSDGAMQQQLELMKAAGMHLLDYSLSQGMEGVAGRGKSRMVAVAGEGSGRGRQLHGDICILVFVYRKVAVNRGKQWQVREVVTADSCMTAPEPSGICVISTQHNDTLHSSPTPQASAPSTPTPAAPATTPSSALIRATAALSAVYCKLAAVVRDLHEQIFKEEADYRAWFNAQVAPLASKREFMTSTLRYIAILCGLCTVPLTVPMSNSKDLRAIRGAQESMLDFIASVEQTMFQRKLAKRVGLCGDEPESKKLAVITL
eukprot:1158053-Pelagomonas_calceolata.AAC.2